MGGWERRSGVHRHVQPALPLSKPSCTPRTPAPLAVATYELPTALFLSFPSAPLSSPPSPDLTDFADALDAMLQQQGAPGALSLAQLDELGQVGGVGMGAVHAPSMFVFVCSADMHVHCTVVCPSMLPSPPSRLPVSPSLCHHRPTHLQFGGRLAADLDGLADKLPAAAASQARFVRSALGLGPGACAVVTNGRIVELPAPAAGGTGEPAAGAGAAGTAAAEDHSLEPHDFELLELYATQHQFSEQVAALVREAQQVRRPLLVPIIGWRSRLVFWGWTWEFSTACSAVCGT